MSTLFSKKLFFIFFLKSVDKTRRVCYYIITARGCDLATGHEGSTLRDDSDIKNAYSPCRWSMVKFHPRK